MNKNHITAAAILGLAFYGDSTTAEAQTLTDGEGNNLFSAVDNSAPTALPTAEPQADTPTVITSGAALQEAASTTGNVNTGAVATTVYDACSSGQNSGAFARDCGVIVTGSTSDAAGTSQALNALNPEQVAAPRTTAIENVKSGLDTISDRMAAGRAMSGMPGFSPDTVIASNLLFGNAAGGGASGDLNMGLGGLFFNLKYLDLEQDRNAYTSGYDLNGWRFTLGGDYRLQENLILGAFGNYASNNIDYRQNKGDMNMDGWGFGAYATYYLNGGLFFEGTIGYDKNDYDLDRRIQYSIENNGVVTNVNQWANSSPEAGVFYFTLGGGYNIDAPGFTITPAVSLNYTQNDIDKYRESMSNPLADGGSLAIAYDSQLYISLTSRVGFVLAKAFSTEQGVFVPQISLDWVHEFRNEQEEITARFVNDMSYTPLLVTTTETDRNYFDLGVGVSGQFAQGFSGFFAVNTLLGYEDISSYTITGGIRKEF